MSLRSRVAFASGKTIWLPFNLLLGDIGRCDRRQRGMCISYTRGRRGAWYLKVKTWGRWVYIIIALTLHRAHRPKKPKFNCHVHTLMSDKPTISVIEHCEVSERIYSILIKISIIVDNWHSYSTVMRWKNMTIQASHTLETSAFRSFALHGWSFSLRIDYG